MEETKGEAFEILVTRQVENAFQILFLTFLQYFFLTLSWNLRVLWVGSKKS